MAILGAITRPLKKAIMKVGRKSKADNKVITDAFEKSTFKSRPQFVNAAEKAIKRMDKKKDKTVTGKKTTNKKKEVPLTPEEEKELEGLIKKQNRDIIAHRGAKIGSTGSTSAGTQKIAIDVPGTGGRRQRKVAHPFGARRGREEHDTREWNWAEIEEQQDKGSGGPGGVNWDIMRGKATTKEQLDEIEGLIKGGEGFSIEKKRGKLIGKKPDWMKGLSEDRIKEILGGPHPSGKRRTNLKKKKKPIKVAKASKKVFRRGGGQALRGFGKATYSNKLY